MSNRMKVKKTLFHYFTVSSKIYKQFLVINNFPVVKLQVKVQGKSIVKIKNFCKIIFEKKIK